MNIIDPALSPLLEELFNRNEESIALDEELDELICSPQAISSLFISHNGNMEEALESAGFDSSFIAPSKLDEAMLEDNPCYKAYMGLDDFRVGDISYAKKHYLPGQLFVSGDKEERKDPLLDFTPNGYFPKRVPYPELSKGGVPWMSIIPHEIATMAFAIERSRGKVLTYGCGLGYFAFMASLHDNVESVTIVEKDKALLDLFAERFLPCFTHKEKIILVNQDALEFAKSKKNKGYDLLFADLWHNADDGLPLYCRLLGLEGVAKENLYWIESGILTYLRRYILTALYEDMLIQKGEKIVYDPSSSEDSILLKIRATFATPIADKASLLDAIKLDSIRKRIIDSRLMID